MKENSKHRIPKSIVRIIYMIIIIYCTSSCTVRELICISATYILFAPVSDWMLDWMLDWLLDN